MNLTTKLFFTTGLVLFMIYSSIQLNAQNEPSKFTKAYNEDYSSRLNWSDTSDFKTSLRGLIAGPKDSIILSRSGDTVWDFRTWNFTSNLLEKSPITVNPSLWRIAKLNTTAGLFEVQKGRIYQIRNFDLAVMSFIIGPEGYIIIDPLTNRETAKAGFKLFKKTLQKILNKRPLKAIIYTHSHADHFGGILGIFEAYRRKKDDIKIYAPKGFMDAAVSENVYAGNVMSQRAEYMYGDLIGKDTLSGIGCGLGKAVANGKISIITPTDIIDTTGTIINEAGLEIEFVYAPDTEAPAEMLFYIKKYNALCAAEDATQTMHNLYTLRGAKTRNAKEWVSTLTMVMDKWGDSVLVEFNSHHWPVWGNKYVISHLETQRAMYKYIHDQTLHYANMGYDMTTTAEILNNLPNSLNQVWSSQGYYGTVNHNVKATWDLYLGWFDGNPSNLHKLPSYESAPKYVYYMGGADELMSKAKKAYANGEYRWVAEVVEHIIVADTSNKEAKYLVADAYEQMGYQAVSGPWRNFYLTGAYELRNGRKQGETSLPPLTFVKAMTLDMKFDMIAIMVNAHKADGKEINFALRIIDHESVVPDTTTTGFQLKYSCLNYLVDKNQKLDFTITINKSGFDKAMLSDNPFGRIQNLNQDKKAGVSIDFGKYEKRGKIKFAELLSVFESVGVPFNIVTPNYPIPDPINPMKVQQK